MSTSQAISKCRAKSKGLFKRLRGIFGAVSFALGYAALMLPLGLALAEKIVPWVPVTRNSPVSDFYRLGTSDESAVKHFVREFPLFVAGRTLVVSEVALWPLAILPETILAEWRGIGPRYEWVSEAPAAVPSSV